MDSNIQYVGAGEADPGTQDAAVTDTSFETQVQDTGVAAPSQSIYSLSMAFGMFNVIAGLMLVAAFLLFFGGLSAYLSRLGLVGREEGLKYMYWGTTVLFMLIVLLAIVQTFQRNPQIMYGAVGLVVVVFAIWAIIKAIQEGGAAEEEH